MPGVLIVEAMAQVAGVLVLKDLRTDRNEKLVLLPSIEDAKFRKPVLPGDQLRIEMLVLKNARPASCKMQGKATVDGQVVAEATMMCKLVADDPGRGSTAPRPRRRHAHPSDRDRRSRRLASIPKPTSDPTASSEPTSRSARAPA